MRNLTTAIMNYLLLLKKILLTTLICLFLQLYVLGQENGSNQFKPDFYPVSPQAASFGKYLDLPVDLSTGRVNYQVPLYTVSEGEVSVPVYLSYNYSGLMVDEKATTTGLGWSLMAGGVITRKVKGKPDEYGYINGSGQWVYDYYHGNLTIQQQKTMIVQSGMGEMDTEPDEFRIMANGLNATFYINHDKEVVFFPDSNLKVQYEYSVGVFKSFTVTDTLGNQYVFSVKDFVNNINFTSSVESYYVSSWYLEKIIPYTTKRPIEFEYIINNTRLDTKTKRVDLLKVYPSPYDQCNNIQHSNPKFTNNTTVFDDRVVKKIISPEQTITFNYTPTDLDRGLVLSSITSTNNIEYLFSLQNNYHLIKQIDKKSGDNIEPYYNFEYKPLTGVHGFDPPSNKRDYLGFYNRGNDGVISDKGVLNYDLDFSGTVSGALKKITHPTGGFTKIEYEQNQVDKDLFHVPELKPLNDCNRAFGLSKYQSVAGQYTYTKQFDKPLTNTETCGDGNVVLNYFFSTNLDGAEAIIRVYNVDGLQILLPLVVEMLPYGQTRIGEVNFGPDFDFNQLSISIDIWVPYGSQDPYPFVSVSTSIPYHLNEDKEPLKSVSYPGIRVKETLHCEGAPYIDCYQKKYIYELEDGTSSGLPFSQPSFWARPISLSSYLPTFQCSVSTISSYSVFPVSTYSGSPVLYKRVKEITQSFNNTYKLGDKVHHFSGNVRPGPIIPYLKEPNFEWENGKLLKEEIKTSDGTLKQKNSLDYNRVINFKPQPDVYSFKSLQTSFRYVDFNVGVNNTVADYTDFEHTKRKFIKSSFLNNSKTSIEYFDNGALSSHSNFEYSSSNLQKTTVEVKDSKGDKLKTVYTYLDDINISSLTPAELIAKEQHRLAIPIKTESSKLDLSENILSDNTQKIKLKEWTNNLILTELIEKSKSGHDLETQITYHNYDNYGNPLEVSKADGTHLVYIWGYNNSKPIAKLENASYSNLTTAQQAAINNAKLAANHDRDHCTDATCTEEQLRTALTNLRAVFPQAMVTTYTYDPLVGVTSITDPRGSTVYYHYDDFNRLKIVNDQDGNVVSGYEYHYREE